MSLVGEETLQTPSIHLRSLASERSLARAESSGPRSDSSQNAANDAEDETALLPVTKKKQFSVLINAFLTICLTVGQTQSYGAFQAAYSSRETTILTHKDRDSTALIAFTGTLAAGLTWSGSILVNTLMSRMKNVRWLTVSGALCMSLGLATASLTTRVYQLLLSQGLLFGMGASFLYYPILGVAPEFFAKHRGAAMGFIFSGGGIGAVIFSPLIQFLITRVGIPWTLRILSFLTLAVCMPLAMAAPASRFPGRRPTHISREIAKRPTFLFSVAAALMLSAGNLIPLTFLSSYSIDLGYSAGFGAALISINNGVNAIARILLGFAGDKVGRQNTLNITVVGTAITISGLWLVSVKTADKSIWISFVVINGIWAGGYSALFPTTVADVFGLQAYASVNGFIYLIRGLGSMFGSPVAGALLSAQSHSNARKPADYSNVVYFNAALMFGASVCVVCVRYFHAKERGSFKLKA